MWSILIIANSVVISIDEYSNINGNDSIRRKSYHKIVENIKDYKLGMTPYVMNNDHNDFNTTPYVVLSANAGNKILEY